MIALVLMAAALPAQQFTPGPLSNPWKSAIVRKMDTRLNDGTTARYRWPAARPAPRKGVENFVYCGWVNAKNRMGAYAGWKPYAVMIGEKGLTIRAEDPGDMVFVEMFCKDFGYDIENPPER